MLKIALICDKQVVMFVMSNFIAIDRCLHITFARKLSSLVKHHNILRNKHFIAHHYFLVFTRFKIKQILFYSYLTKSRKPLTSNT